MRYRQQAQHSAVGAAVSSPITDVLLGIKLFISHVDTSQPTSRGDERGGRELAEGRERERGHDVVESRRAKVSVGIRPAPSSSVLSRPAAPLRN